MSEKRFERWNDHSCKVKDNQEDTFLNWEDVVKKLNEQQDTIGEQKIAIDELITDYKKLEKENRKLRKDLYIVQTDCKNAKESKEHWINKAKELEEKNKQIGFLKRDLYTIIRDTKETPFGNSITMTEIRDRWE